jgi:hypothetical protein
MHLYDLLLLYKTCGFQPQRYISLASELCLNVSVLLRFTESADVAERFGYGLYSGSARFETQPCHRLTSLTFPWFSQVIPGEYLGYITVATFTIY